MSERDQPYERVDIEKHLKRRKVGDIGDIATEMGCGINELSKEVNKRVQGMFNLCKTNTFSVGEELDLEFDWLFRLYASTRIVGSDGPMASLAKSLATRDSFFDKFAKRRNEKTIINFCNRLERFSWLSLDTESALEVLPFSRWKSDVDWVYACEGDWVKISEDKHGSSAFYVRPDLVRELIMLEESGGFGGDLYHASNSTSLDNIANIGSIVNSRELLRLGVIPSSGEVINGGFVDDTAMEQRSSHEVYAALSPTKGYVFRRWFDEFGVFFGVRKSDVRDRLINVHGVTTPYLEHSSDGITVGPEIPMSMVVDILCPFSNMPLVKEWALVNAPNAKVFSIEAYDVNSRFGKNGWDNPEERVSSWKSKASLLTSNVIYLK